VGTHGTASLKQTTGTPRHKSIWTLAGEPAVAHNVNDEKRRAMVSAAASLASGQYGFAEGLRAARSAGLRDVQVATLLGVPDYVVSILWCVWDLEQQ
jgi:hypothetical protein